VEILAVVIISYLLGSISFGYLVAKYWKGIDIRQFGSGNVGTTNVFRTLGPVPGVIVFFGDFFKGAVATWLGLWAGNEWIGIFAGLVAMIGHSHSLFLNFKGGKVIATGVGVLFALNYKVALAALAIWAVVLFLFRYVSLASIIAAVMVPIMLVGFQAPIPYIVFGLTEQDKKIVGYAHDEGKASIIVVNKWDLVEKDGKTMNKYTDTIREELGFMQYAPVIYVSAKTGQRVIKTTQLANYVAEQHAMRIATSTLNTLVRDAVTMNPPPTDKGRKLKVLFATQVGVKPPTFVVFVNDPELMHFSYERYLENQLRSTFGFEGTPIRLIVRARKEEE